MIAVVGAWLRALDGGVIFTLLRIPGLDRKEKKTESPSELIPKNPSLSYKNLVYSTLGNLVFELRACRGPVAPFWRWACSHEQKR
jgi:hypothetical protein